MSYHYLRKYWRQAPKSLPYIETTLNDRRRKSPQRKLGQFGKLGLGWGSIFTGSSSARARKKALPQKLCHSSSSQGETKANYPFKFRHCSEVPNWAKISKTKKKLWIPFFTFILAILTSKVNISFSFVRSVHRRNSPKPKKTSGPAQLFKRVTFQ